MGVATVDCDVLVIGAGGAGLAAACMAAEAGAKVIVLEKLDELRGTTSWSVGSIAAAGTRLQRRAGLTDTAREFAEDIVIAHPQVEGTAHLVRLLAEGAAAAVDWLERIGVVFVGPFPEPPNRVPRMHNAVPAGSIYLRMMAKEARRLGVDMRLGAKVTGLIQEDGKVCGARLQRDGVAHDISARSVVLAAGDYSGSDAMRAQYLPPAAVAAIPINAHSTGDGHRLALDAGAQLRGMESVFGPQLRFVPATHTPWIQRLPEWRWIHQIGAAILNRAPRAILSRTVSQLLVSHMSPSEALFKAGAVMVDLDAERINDSARPAQELAGRPRCTGYLVGDAAMAEKFSAYPYFISTAPGIAYAYFNDYVRARPDLVHWADDAGELAKRISVDPVALARSTSELKGRLFALGPCNAALTVAEGGARIDGNCHVLNPGGQPIAGLYAAGGNGQSGLLLKGHGLHIAWAITSGMVAGKNAAAESRR